MDGLNGRKVAWVRTERNWHHGRVDEMEGVGTVDEASGRGGSVC